MQQQNPHAHAHPFSAQPADPAYPLALPLHRPSPYSSSTPHNNISSSSSIITNNTNTIASPATSRPHTVHASSSARHFPRDHLDGDGASSTDSMAVFPPTAVLPDRRLSRDDTATGFAIPRTAPSMSLQRLKSDQHLSSRARWAETNQREAARDLWSSRRNSTWRMTSVTSSVSAPATSSTPVEEGGSSSSRPTLVSRRFSKSYKDGFRNLKDFRDRIRRASTPQPAEISLPFSQTILPSTSTVPPRSPSKRNGKHGDDRPKKHVRNLLSSSDRKDTPAPPAGPNNARPESRQLPTSMPGFGQPGDRARYAAAAWKYNASPFPEPQWNSEDEDFYTRRSRVGSISSAADSGADLSSYAGSSKDNDGDIEMAQAEPVAYDFLQFLPSEISLQIFEYLDAYDLMRVDGVSRSWREMASETSVWRNAFLRRFQREVFTDPPPVQVGGAGCGLPNRPNQEWKKMYKARMELEKNWRKGPKDAGKAIYLAGHTDSVYCVQFDEEKIITGSRDRTIRVWDINNFTCKMVIGGPNVRPLPGPKVLRTVDYPDFHIATASVNGTAYGDSIFKVPSQWHDASILCLQYDDEILVTGSSDCDLLVWDIKTFEPIKRLRKHSGGVLDVALDAKHIVSCSKDSRIIVWNRDTYEFKGELTGHRGPVNAVQLRGKYLASASGDGIARLWDIEQMKLVREFSQKERGLAAVEFSEDMKYVLAGGNDTITYKFETETGREVQQFMGHSQLVRSLWLDGANNRVVTGSYDLDIRVYDFATGEQMWRAEEWTTSWMLAAKSDYRRIVATSQDGRILLVDFGLHKGSDIRDGQPLDDVDLLRGLEHTSAIRWRDPWKHDREIQEQRLRDNNVHGEQPEPRVRQSSVAANGAAPTVSLW